MHLCEHTSKDAKALGISPLVSASPQVASWAGPGAAWRMGLVRPGQAGPASAAALARLGSPPSTARPACGVAGMLPLLIFTRKQQAEGGMAIGPRVLSLSSSLAVEILATPRPQSSHCCSGPGPASLAQTPSVA